MDQSEVKGYKLIIEITFFQTSTIDSRGITITVMMLSMKLMGERGTRLMAFDLLTPSHFQSGYYILLCTANHIKLC